MRNRIHFSEDNIDLAFDWICKQRVHHPPNADIWHLRAHWSTAKPCLLDQLRTKQYRFSPMQRIIKQDGSALHMWSSQDSLVLKVLSIILSRILPFSDTCTHLKGHCGLKSNVQKVFDALPDYRFVIRTDVKSYYASIDHQLLLDKLAIYVRDKFVLNLLWQYIHRSIDCGGTFIDVAQGISRGCSLSPIIGAFYLSEIDASFNQNDTFYIRYMDDILILRKTRWKLRRAVKKLNLQLNPLKLEKHPNKTYIARIEGI